MFAALVPAILLGAAAERSRILPAMLFIFCWTTLCYDPLAHWVWSANGWAAKWGVLDCELDRDSAIWRHDSRRRQS